MIAYQDIHILLLLAFIDYMFKINKECSLRGKRADPATGSLVILLGGAVVQRLKETC